MARIQRKLPHNDVDGRRILQIWTTGRPERQIPGKTSQTIQLTGDLGRELLHILKRAFDLHELFYLDLALP